MPKPTIESFVTGGAEGAYGVPKWLREAVDTRDRLNVATRSAVAKINEYQGTLRQIENTAVMDAIQRASKGEPLDDLGDKMAEAELEEKRRAALGRALNQALETAGAQLRTLIDQRADDIIRESLQPALTETLEQASKALTGLDGIEVDPSIILAAGSEKQRAAWKGLVAAATRYDAIRAAQLAITRERRAKPLDPALAEFHNFRDLRTPATYSQPQAEFPTEQPQKLVAILRSEFEPWVPTKQEQDEQSRRAAEKDERGAVAVS